METTTYTSKTLDHLGLIAGICRQIGLADLIDESCPGDSPEQVVSNGKALEAMILNGLGFVNKRLYLIPQFFEDKPLDLLLGEGIEASHLNDDRLGRALDTFYAAGVTALFAKVSRRIFKVLDLKPSRGHLDTTTMSVYGRYNSDAKDPKELHITQGYSKDHRPDLAQATLQLICDHLSGIPVHMQALDGNSNDSETFRKVIQDFGNQLSADGLDTIVADSKLYSAETLKALNDCKLNWICRVPGTLDAVRTVLNEVTPDNLKPLGQEGYSYTCYSYEYAGIAQDWVVYRSESAAQREAATLERQVAREQAAAQKDLAKLCRERFHCPEDARTEAEKCGKKWKWHRLSNIQIVAQTEYERAGRPSATDKGKTSHSIEAKLVQDKQAFEDELFRRSMFILATNLHADTKNECAALLSAYKEQHQVEKGFRFIKDPNVVASSFYVQKPERVEALMFVMTTCLAVYSILEYRIRQALQKAEKTIPDQKGKATSNPTARWVFQLFVGIHVLKLPDGQSVVLNLKSVHRDILELLSYQNFYS